VDGVIQAWDPCIWPTRRMGMEKPGPGGAPLTPADLLFEEANAVVHGIAQAAESLFEQALSAAPRHPNSLYQSRKLTERVQTR
jgi:hypothetical protein